MTTRDHLTHAEHPHHHDANCGHIAVKHGDHVDYLHDGHPHHQEGDDVEEHVIEVTAEIRPGARRRMGTKVTRRAMSMDPAAGMRRSRTATTLTTSSTVGSIITTATIATITVHSTS